MKGMDRMKRTVLIILLVVAAASAASGQGRAARRVAVTFDDLPMTGDAGQSTGEGVLENNKKIVAALKAKGVPAIGFVNERGLGGPGQREARTQALRAWLDAGMELGNHTYSHKSFYNTPTPAFEQEVVKGEPVTRQLLAERGKRLRYFRHPFLNTGRTPAAKREFEKFLAGRGYRVAPVTIDNSEWIFAREYADALAKGDAEKARRVAEGYVPYMESMFEFYEKLSVDLFGRELPQVLLVHANQLNGDHFAEVIEMMRRRGYSFVSLDDALADPAYSSRDDYVGAVGISWLQRWLVTRGQPFRKEPYLPEYMRQFDPDDSGSDFKTKRLASNKWKSARKDFLVGDADNYEGLVEADFAVTTARGAAMDYELGAKPPGAADWQAVEHGERPRLQRGDNLLWDVLKNALRK
jgi:peptidoglycan/xylan/chitin deacetylase (PgdA/CDA1 family)